MVIIRQWYLCSQVIGPILVEVDSPVFTDHIAVSTKQYAGTRYLVAQWDKSGFADKDLIYRYSYAVGRFLLRVACVIFPWDLCQISTAVHKY